MEAYGVVVVLLGWGRIACRNGTWWHGGGGGGGAKRKGKPTNAEQYNAQHLLAEIKFKCAAVVLLIQSKACAWDRSHKWILRIGHHHLRFVQTSSTHSLFMIEWYTTSCLSFPFYIIVAIRQRCSSTITSSWSLAWFSHPTCGILLTLNDRSTMQSISKYLLQSLLLEVYPLV